MIGARAGLYAGEEHLTLAVWAGRRVETATVPADGEAALLLKAEAGRRRLRRVRVGLPRALVTVKPIEFPQTLRGSLDQMLPFELERHVPYPPEDAIFAWSEQPRTPHGSLRVLLVATERRAVDRVRHLLAEPQLRPASLTVACHDLPSLVKRAALPEQLVWAHDHGPGVDLLFLGRGQVRLSRSITGPDAAELAREIVASLPIVRWRDCDALWVSGDRAEELLADRGLAGVAASVSAPPWGPGVREVLAQVPHGQRGPTALALAAAAGPRQPALNLLPEPLRPRILSAAELVTGGMVVLAVGLGLAALLMQGRRDQHYLDDLDAALRRLDPEVKAVERISGELAERRRLLATITGLEGDTLRALPVLRDLTDLLPPDAWLSSLSLDARGAELTGQAGAASQLIPLLEGSPWFERVEFTSPVTRGRDKEQFRIRAGWERRATAAPGPGLPGAAAPEGPAVPVPRAAPEGSSPPGRRGIR